MNIDLIRPTGAPPPVKAEMTQPVTRENTAASGPKPTSDRVVANQEKQSLKKDSEPSREEVNDAISRLSSFVSSNQSEINFSVDESSGVRVVKVIDRNSKEVIRQMPSEEAVALAQALDKLQGLLIRDKA